MEEVSFLYIDNLLLTKFNWRGSHGELVRELMDHGRVSKKSIIIIVVSKEKNNASIKHSKHHMVKDTMK